MYELNNSFSVCFNIMKIKYNMYDQSFDELGLIGPNDSVNVFINLESVLHHLSTIRDLDKKLVTETDYPIIMTADILNLAAHYKRFFRDNRLPTRVFLYMTDLDSTSFKESKFNEDYRSYYLTKFNDNPRYYELTNTLKSQILPDAKQICEFLPDIHLITTKNIDSSVLPAIIAKKYPGSKNVIVTGDIYETQYVYYPSFGVHYIRKSPMYSSTTWTLKGFLKEIFKREPDETTETNILRNLSFYDTMLSSFGDRPRSIDPIRRIGAISTLKLFRSALTERKLEYDTESIELIKEIFPDDAQEEITDNFYQYSIPWKEKELTDADIFSVDSQIVNRFDNNSLLKLNATRFYNHQLMLEELTMQKEGF